MQMTRKEFRKKKAKLKRKNYNTVLIVAGLSIATVCGYSITNSKDKPNAASNEIEYAQPTKDLPNDFKGSTKADKSFSRADEIAKVVSKGNEIISKLDKEKKVIEFNKKTNIHSQKFYSTSSSSYIAKSSILKGNNSGDKNINLASVTSQIDNLNLKTINVFSPEKNKEEGAKDLLMATNMEQRPSHLDKDSEVAINENNTKKEIPEMKLNYSPNKMVNTQEVKNPSEVSNVNEWSITKEFTGFLDARCGDDIIELEPVSEGENEAFYTKDKKMIQELASYKISSLLTIRYSKDHNNSNEIKDVILRSTKTANYAKEFEAFYAGKKQNSVLLKHKETDLEATEYKMSDYFAQENKDFLPDSKVWVVGVKHKGVFQVENIDELEKPKPKAMLIQSRPTIAAKKEEKPEVEISKVDIPKTAVVKSNNEDLKKPEVENVVESQQEIVQEADKAAEISSSDSSLKGEQQPQQIAKTEEEVTKSTKETIVEDPKTPVQTVDAVETENQDVTTDSSDSTTNVPLVKDQEEITN